MHRFMHRLVLVAAGVIMTAGGSAQAGLSVMTTTTDLASLTQTIGGEGVAEVRSICRPLEDPHYLDATPRMIVQLSNADLFVKNGMDLEVGWIPEVLRQVRNRAVREGGPGYVDASEGVTAIQVPDGRPGELRAMGDVHPQGNPHYTMDPIQTITPARNIAAGLKRVDPARRAHYDENLEAYIAEAEKVVEQYKERFEQLGEVRVVTYHNHFDYMFRRLGIEVVDSIEPRPGIEPSARHLATLISNHDPETIDLVVMEPWHNQRVATQVARGIGVPLLVLCPAVNSCDDTGTIIEVFRRNAEKLLAHLEDGR